MLQKGFGAPISYKSFSLNPFKGFIFYDIKADDIFEAESLIVRYNISSIINRNILYLKISNFSFDMIGYTSANRTQQKKHQIKGIPQHILSIEKLILEDGIVDIDTGQPITLEINRIDGNIGLWSDGIDGRFHIDVGEITVEDRKFGNLNTIFKVNRKGEFAVLHLKSSLINIKKIAGFMGKDSVAASIFRIEHDLIRVDSLKFSAMTKLKMGNFILWGATASKFQLDTIKFEFSMLPNNKISIKYGSVVVSQPFKEILQIHFIQIDMSNKSVYTKFNGYGMFVGEGLIRGYGQEDSLWIGVAMDSVRTPKQWLHNVFVSASLLGATRKIMFHELSVDDYHMKGMAYGDYTLKNQLLNANFQIDTLDLTRISHEWHGWLFGTGEAKFIGKKLVKFAVSGRSIGLKYKKMFSSDTVSFYVNSDSVVLRAEKTTFQKVTIPNLALTSHLKSDTNNWSVSLAISDSGNAQVKGRWSMKEPNDLFFAIDYLDFRYSTIHRTGEFPLIFYIRNDTVFGQLDTTSILEGEMAFDLHYFPQTDTVMLSLFTRNISFYELQQIGLVPLCGYLNGKLEITNTLSTPNITLSGNFDSTHVVADTSQMLYRIGRAVEGLSVEFRMTYADSILNIKSIRLGDGTALFSRGFLPLILSLKPFKFEVPDREIYLAFDTDSFDVALLRPFLKDFMLVGNGYFMSRVRMGGTLSSPIMTGKLTAIIRDALLTSTNTPLQNLIFSGDFEGDSLVASDIKARSGQYGRIQGHGKMVFGRQLLTDFTFKLDSVPMYPTHEIASIGSGVLTIKGPVPQIFIGADINLNEAHINIPFGGGAMTSSSPQPSPIRFRYHLYGDRNIFFYNPNLEMELSMDIVISKEDEVNVVTTGEFRVLNGQFYYLDRRFDITEGWVRLAGGPTMNPEIHLKAEGVVADTVIVTIMITGTLKHPEIELTSEPPMDRLDIVSLIAFGRTLGELQLEREDIELIRKRALSFAEGMVSREIRNLLSSYGIGISEFMVQADPWSGNYTSFTVGFRPSPNMLFRYSYDPRAVDHFTVQIKYFLRRNIAVYAERERSGEFGTGIELEFRW